MIASRFYASRAFVLGISCIVSSTGFAGLPAVSITQVVSETSEADSTAPATFTVSRTGSTSQQLVVRIGTVASSTASTSDWSSDQLIIASFQQVVFIPAGASSRIVEITADVDNLVEGSEILTLQVGTSDNYTIDPGSSDSFDITLTDDPPIVSLALDPETLVEGDPPGSLTLTRSGGDLSVQLGVRVAFDRGTATQGLDFTVEGASQNPSLILIPPTETSEVREVVPNSDSLIEGDETIGLEVLPSTSSNFSYLIANATDSILLIDDVATVSIEATDAEASESGDPGLFRVTRSGGNENGELFVYLTLTGTANAPGAGPVDYDIDELGNSVNGRFVLMAAGQLTYDIPVEPRFDDLDEPVETVILTIRDDIGQYLVDESQPSATVTIENVNDLVFSDSFD